MTMKAGEKLPRFEDIESKVMQFDRSIESVPAQGGMPICACLKTVS